MESELKKEFIRKAISHMRGSGCQKCAKERSEKSKYKGLAHFVEKSNIVHDNKYDYSESSYTGAHETTLIKCPIHGNFLQICHNHTQGKGCPKCVSNCSKTEIEIREFLSSCINVEYSNRTILGRKEIDIFIPSKNLGIEYNGIYWHSEKKKGKEHLLDKTQLAEIKGVRLIHVQDIVKSRLLNIRRFF